VPVWAYTLIVLNALTLLDAADATVFILLTGRDGVRNVHFVIEKLTSSSTEKGDL
jgi:hypothetical protein